MRYCRVESPVGAVVAEKESTVCEIPDKRDARRSAAVEIDDYPFANGVEDYLVLKFLRQV